MAPPTVQGSPATQTVTTAATTITVTAPTSIAAGELLIAFLSSIDGGADSFPVGPSGWFHVGGGIVRDATVNASLVCFMKIATGSEPGSYVWTAPASVKWCGYVRRVSGWGGFTDAAPVSQVNSSASTTTSHPGVTTLTADSLLFVATSARPTGPATITGTPPSGMTEDCDVCTNAASGQNLSLQVAYQTIAAAGATGAKNGTITTSLGSVALSIVIPSVLLSQVAQPVMRPMGAGGLT